MNGCNDIYSSYIHGSKGSAVASRSGDCGLPSSIHKGQNFDRSSALWTSEVRPDERNPYTNEWNDLIDAIRNDKPYNEVKRGVEASVVLLHGPHGRPHRPGDHLRTDAQPRA
jgi:predicted dehydrogenase